MSRKGFTLVEVMATIAILGILVILVTPSIIDIRKDMLQKTYDSRVSLIKNAALDYANDNLDQVPVSVNTSLPDSSCLTVTIKKLIDDGYLAGSDNNKTEMHNPVTNENMNSKIVCIRYSDNDVMNRKLMAYIME
ncbi:MAG: prepilin-type N-terminal cleavage/methylation domain-containing protein [Bacilli bacterium]|nr:prepilin-type N-terminal cleavage/methylation domain-containing protein [Bacilli bacterium]